MNNFGKMIGLTWLLLAIIIASSLAFGFGTIVKLIPWSIEKKLAQVYGVPSSWGVCKGSIAAQKSLDKLVKRIYPVKVGDEKFPLSVEVINRSEVNAFATLGGKIYVNRGLLERATSAEELTGVLAHEIEHVRNRHIMEGMLVHMMTIEGLRIIASGSVSEISGNFLHMHFTRSEEELADIEGLSRLQKAKVSPKGIYNFFKRMESDSTLAILFSDHPSDQRRIDRLKPFLEMKSVNVLEDRDWEDLKSICSL